MCCCVRQLHVPALHLHYLVIGLIMEVNKRAVCNKAILLLLSHMLSLLMFGSNEFAKELITN